MLTLRIVLVVAAVIPLAWRPRSPLAMAATGCCAVADLSLGAASSDSLALALRQTIPLALFLTAAIWLAGFAVRAGLAEDAAALLLHAARGSRGRLYALVCVLCATLTAAVSLDGAVILMVPVVVALARFERGLRRPLLLATVAVANAFSLALPQGNPTNLIVIERLGLSPAAFVAHLFVPALIATLVCVAALAFVERASLSGPPARVPVRRAPRGADAGLAAGGLVAAPLASIVATLLGAAPWWGLCAVAAAIALAARLGGRPAPRFAVPARVCAQVAALIVAFAALAGALRVPALAPSSLAATLALALTAAVAAAAVNNLPATVVLAGVLGARTLSAYAALAGLSVGALATPHGSVATLIAFDRAGPGAPSPVRYLGLWAPAAAAATTAAAAALWLLA